MKIAVACDDMVVTGHFGHCKNFRIYQVEEGKILSEESIENPGHRPGFLPNFLADRGVEVVISGSMGAGAAKIFEERGVKFVTGAQGDATEVVAQHLAGNLKSSGINCHHHEEDHTHGEGHCHTKEPSA